MESVQVKLVCMGPLPLWAGTLLGVLALALGVVLLRAELRGRGRVRRAWLYGLRGAEILIAAMLVLQPVLLLRRETRRPAPVVAVADRSRSMLRRDAYEIGRLLDLAERLQGGPIEGRNPVAVGIRGWAQAAGQGLREGLEQLRRMHAETVQGMPWGASFSRKLEREGERLAGLIESGQAYAAALGRLELTLHGQAGAAGADEGDGVSLPEGLSPEMFRGLAPVLTLLERAGPSLRTADGPLSEADLAQHVSVYEALREALESAADDMARLQRWSDETFWTRLPTERRAALNRAAEKTRFDLARAVVAGLEQETEFAERFGVHRMGWEALDASNATPDTDVYALLEDAVGWTIDKTVAAVALVSDGGQNLPERPEVMRRLAARGVPLVTVGVGREASAWDVAVEDYDLPGILLQGRRARLAVTLKTEVPPETPIDLVLTAGGERLAGRRIAADGQYRRRVSLEFDVPREAPEIWTLEARTEQPDAAPENNAVTFAVHLATRPARVLVVARTPRWDIVYLLQALDTDAFRSDTVFWGAVQDDDGGELGSGSGKIPDSADGFARYDVVVLDGDPFPGMSAEDDERLREFVARGGTLIVMGAEPAGGYFARLAGVLGGAGRAGGAGQVLPDAAARLYPAVALAANASLTYSAWRVQPPAASVWDVGAQDAVLLRSGQTPCLALRFHGRGRIYAMGVGEWFRLREWSDGHAARRFLRAWLEDAARPVFDGPDGTAGCYPPAPVAGAPLHLLRANGGSASPWSVTMPGGETHAVRWPPSARPPVAGRFRADEEGEIVIREGGNVLRVLPVLQPILSEDVHLRLNRGFLERLAEEAGGAYAPLEDLRRAFQAVQPRTHTEVAVTEWRVWNWPALLGALVLLLTLDWILRRRSGLVL